MIQRGGAIHYLAHNSTFAVTRLVSINQFNLIRIAHNPNAKGEGDAFI